MQCVGVESVKKEHKPLLRMKFGRKNSESGEAVVARPIIMTMAAAKHPKKRRSVVDTKKEKTKGKGCMPLTARHRGNQKVTTHRRRLRRVPFFPPQE